MNNIVHQILIIIIKAMDINGVAIKKRRQELKLTQEELANKIGVSRNTIKNYENGGVIPESKRELLSKFLFGLESFFVQVQNIGNEMFENNSPIIDRIKQVISHLGLTQSAFAEKMEMKQQNLSRILNGKANIGDGVINKIILSYDVNKEWLISGEGNMLKANSSKKNEAKMIDPSFVEVIKIPVKAKAGYLACYNDETFLKEMPVVLVQVDLTFHGKYRCFEVEGDSMNDGTLKSICDGDTILCREVKKDLWCYKLHYNQWMFVINHVDGLLVKQIVDHDVEKGTITCHSLNPIYGEDFVLNLNDVKELYNVIKITDRNLKL